MKTVQVTKYVSDDGVHWDEESAAVARDAEVLFVGQIMGQLDPAPKLDFGQHYQHDIHVVDQVKRELIRYTREGELKKAMTEGKNFLLTVDDWVAVHPAWFVKLLDHRTEGPLLDAWRRFWRIDPKGREWDQPYFAYGAGVGAGDATPINETKPSDGSP